MEIALDLLWPGWAKEPSAAARCRGVARAILAKLEQLASDRSYQSMRLETGTRQSAAIRFYQPAGYRRIERYGRYVNDPLSVCFEKKCRC